MGYISRYQCHVPWPNNVLCIISDTVDVTTKFSSYAAKALNWALDQCTDSSDPSALDAKIFRMCYQQHMSLIAIEAKLNISRNILEGIREKVKKYLCSPIIKDIILSSTEKIPEYRIDLYAFGIPVNTIYHLQRAGLSDIHQLLRTTAAQLENVNFISKTKIAQIDDALNRHGLALPKEDQIQTAYLQPWEAKVYASFLGVDCRPWLWNERHKKAFDLLFNKLTPVQKCILKNFYHNRMTKRQIADILTADMNTKWTTLAVSHEINFAHSLFCMSNAREILINGID